MKENTTLKKNKKWGEDVFSLLSWFDIEKVRNAKVMVVGAGALGNEVLKNLALFGIGNIIVVDFDTIEYSNLSRSVLFREEDAKAQRSKVEAAADGVIRINPGINIKSIHADVGPGVGLGLIREVDVVIGCLDSRFARYIINLHCNRVNKPWVDGGIENMEGYTRVFVPGKSCYNCILTDREIEMIHARTGCPDIARVNVSQGRIATTPVSASIIGAMQVQEALKIIHKDIQKDHKKTNNNIKPHVKGIKVISGVKNHNANGYRSLEGKMFKYDGLYLGTSIYRMDNYNEDCLSHEYWDPVIKIEDLSTDTTVKDALNIIRQKLNEKEISIILRNNFFIKTITPMNISGVEENTIEVMQPQSELADFLKINNIQLQNYHKVMQDYTEEIDENFPRQKYTLKQAGIPCYDILEVSTSNGHRYIELTGDKNFLMS